MSFCWFCVFLHSELVNLCPRPRYLIISGCFHYKEPNKLACFFLFFFLLSWMKVNNTCKQLGPGFCSDNLICFSAVSEGEQAQVVLFLPFLLLLSCSLFLSVSPALCCKRCDLKKPKQRAARRAPACQWSASELAERINKPLNVFSSSLSASPQCPPRAPPLLPLS